MRSKLFLLALAFPFVLHAQDVDAPQYVRAKVESLSQEKDANFGDMQRTVRNAELRILDGEDTGTVITLENGVIDQRRDMQLSEGETVVLQRFTNANGEAEYILQEKYRIPSLITLGILFFLMAVILGGRTGAFSIIGLGVSIAILVLGVVPQIIAGHSPLFVSTAGAVAIAFTSLYLAHGFTRRTTIALMSTIITLTLSMIIAVISVSFGKLFGMGTEESIFLQIGQLQHIDLRGLLLGGIIIGALGVLDDITTAQTAAVDEIAKANPSLGFDELYRRGTSVGREHIASLINTLALAYVGASLPLLLLFYVDADMPTWVILNSEFLSEEIIRTLVGSMTLLVAVPISTWMAARSFAHGHHTHEKGGHVHSH